MMWRRIVFSCPGSLSVNVSERDMQREGRNHDSVLDTHDHRRDLLSMETVDPMEYINREQDVRNWFILSRCSSTCPGELDSE